MYRKTALVLILLLAAPLSGGAIVAHAQSAAEESPPPVTIQPPPPYEDRLLRLAEILGSVQYLRNLCNEEPETIWRENMQALIDNETEGEPNRREHITAGYNRGFRAFASVYTTCTNAAREAEARYRREGATLVAEMVARYGN